MAGMRASSGCSPARTCGATQEQELQAHGWVAAMRPPWHVGFLSCDKR